MAICPECGAVVPNGTHFCTSCGTKVDLSESRRPVSERAPKQAAGQERVIVQPSRAERQRRPITPIDEHRPVPGDMPLRGASQSESRMQREREDREQPPLFDDDEFYETRRPHRAVREAQQEKLKAEGLRPRQAADDLRPRQDAEEFRTRQKAPAQTRQSQPRPTRQSQVPVLGTMEYLISVLVLLIPVVGLVMGFLWSRGASNPNKRNLCNAMVILNAVEIVGFGIFALFKWVFA